MVIKRSFFKCLVLIVLLIVFLIPFGVSAADLIGNVFTIADYIDNNKNLKEVNPVIAYNSQRKEYLVVWYNDRDGNDDLRAQRVSHDGRLLGGPFYIVGGPGNERRYPDVAYNSGHDQYLVVWENYEPNIYCKSIRARRVSGTGEMLDITDIIVINSGNNFYSESAPAVAYASTSDLYTLVWSEADKIKNVYTIYGRPIDENGTMYGVYEISKGPEPRLNPDIAYNRSINRHLVVWEQLIGPYWKIKGRQVHGDGETFDAIRNYSNLINNSNETKAAVAAVPNPTGNIKFMVALQTLYGLNDHDVIGLPVNEDGSGGARFFISNATADETSPTIVGCESNQQYYAAWRFHHGVVDNPIKARAYNISGSPASQNFILSGVASDLPAVACGLAGDFFIVWQDLPGSSATHTNIFGQIIGNRLYLPMIVN